MEEEKKELIVTDKMREFATDYAQLRNKAFIDVPGVTKEDFTLIMQIRRGKGKMPDWLKPVEQKLVANLTREEALDLVGAGHILCALARKKNPELKDKTDVEIHKA